MTDYSKTYAKWIEGFTKDQFDDFIKVFLKDYWDLDTVSITDGTNDGGIDVKVFEKKRGKKIPLQITIDKNTIPKLKKDLKKISDLIENHSYSNHFYFYCSKGISEKNVIELKDFARREYDIELEIFDNKLIGSYTDETNYSLTRLKIKEILDLYPKSEESYFDENKKLYFDYLSYAAEAKELKEKFISSFIINFLYSVNGQGINLEDLKRKVISEFDVTDSGSYFERIVQGLLTSKKLIKKESTLTISEIQFKEIKKIKENSELLEVDFVSKLQDLINKSNSSVEIRLIINKLKIIYENQKQLNIDEISEEVNDDVDSSIKDFISYVKKSFEDQLEAKTFMENVFLLCSINNFIEITTTGRIYKKLINNPEFKAYTNRVNKEIFLDTNVLLYLLLVFREPNVEYDNNYFNISKDLFDLINSENNYGNYNTTHLYIYELSDYIKRSIKLIPLDKLGIFSKLGGSDNVIYNFYLHLKSENFIDYSFRKFIESFRIRISEAEKQNDYLRQVLYNIFKTNNIEIDDVESYDRNHRTKKEHEKISKQLIDTYSDLKVKRTIKSLRFDSLTIQHISSDRFSELSDPTLITWDKTFRKFRQSYLSTNPNANYWHIFTPGNFLDHISLMQFKINGDSISNELLSILDNEFQIVKKVRKLSDALSTIIDLNSEVGINLSTGIAEIREDFIYQINIVEETKTVESKPQAIDQLINDLIDYYDSDNGLYDFNDFKEVLKVENNVDKFLKFLDTESKHFIQNASFSSNYLKSFDSVIKYTKDKN